MEIELKIKNRHLMVYEVDPTYRKYLEHFETRVSQKVRASLLVLALTI